ncbi:MAG: hypothetical protein JWM77_2937 [Rhodospirillales bacterium]|jgi:hypothetical protein|nr:hypothetical protein [Rhodospirillales bacterium]
MSISSISSGASASSSKAIVSTAAVSAGNGTITTTITYADGTTDISSAIDYNAQNKPDDSDLSTKTALGNLLDPRNVDQNKSLLAQQEDKSR